MEAIEISAKSEEEAVALALAELGLGRSDVEVVILKKGRSGILGFGGQEVTVKVTPIEELSEDKIGAVSISKEVLENMLSMMGIEASVNLEERGEGDERVATLDIRGDDLGILIGRRGETLTSLQYLVSLILSRQAKARVSIVVDVEGYRERRRDSLRLLAQRLAERVTSTGKSVTLEPMPPNERRIIHLELHDHPDITTQSTGYGMDRRVAIVSKSQI